MHLHPISSPRGPVRPSRFAFPALVFAAACLGTARAQFYHVKANAANSTAIKQDGLCNLTEAIECYNLGHPVNADCVPDPIADRYLFIDGANTTYQLAAGTQIKTGFTLEIDVPGVIIEAAGTPLTVMPEAQFFRLFATVPATLRVKAGSTGRAIRNSGWMIVDKMTLQGGDVSGFPGEEANGGVIFNAGQFSMGGGSIQGGTAMNGGGLYNQKDAPSDGVWQNVSLQQVDIRNNTAIKRGGGAYNNGRLDFQSGNIKGNKAGEGAGIFQYQPYKVPTSANYTDLSLTHATVSDNKAIANELTPVPGPTGTAIAGTGSSSSGEVASKAFDDDFATKWCSTAGSAPTPAQPATLTYTFPSGTSKVVTAYSVTSANDNPSRDPMDWQLQGYNGSNWIALHSVTGQTFSASSLNQRYQTESYNPELVGNAFSNTTAYKAYRLVITKNAGGVNITQLAELHLFPQGETGNGGGLYDIGHLNLTNATFSGNIAGCVNASCACTAAFCASASNTSPSLGKGGGIYSGNPAPEALTYYVTVAGNSASQGGGVYSEHFEHWGWSWSLFGKNSARTSRNPEPDFHGNPRTLFTWHENFFQNPAGVVNLSQGGRGGDVAGVDPQLNALADNGGEFPASHPWTHSLMSASPARDATADDGSGLGRDARGIARPQGAYSDFGAYERQ